MVQYDGKPFEWSVVQGLFITLENSIKREKKKRRPVPLCRKQANIVMHINPSIGLANGNRSLHPDYFSSVKRVLKEMLVRKPKSYTRMSNDAQAWADRLSKLANIPLEDACLIAKTRVDDKRAQLALLQKEQDKSFSVLRSQVIAKLEKKESLKPIKNKEQAEAIVQAHKQYAEKEIRT